MIHKHVLSTVIIMMLLFGAAAAAFAQDDQQPQEFGSITGAVLHDINANGICTEEDEPGETGIPIEFVNLDNNAIINLSSGSEGYYELQSADLGSWQVTVNPGTGWRITSQQTHQVLLAVDDPDSEEIDFCIVQVSTTSTGTGTSPGQKPVLPESGAPLSAPLTLAVGLGLLFLFAGVVLFAHSRTIEEGGTGS